MHVRLGLSSLSAGQEKPNISLAAERDEAIHSRHISAPCMHDTILHSRLEESPGTVMELDDAVGDSSRIGFQSIPCP
jgi:hypothetical protein